tara:strand:+ start:444 stop:683 length:240 start_codon:yes stop_codon:yes gene_type:complete
MFERIKKILGGALEIVAGLVVFGAGVAYIGLSGILSATVINEIRLDTYIDYSTGIEMVVLFFLLVWVPILLVRSVGGRR